MKTFIQKTSLEFVLHGFFSKLIDLIKEIWCESLPAKEFVTGLLQKHP